MSLGDAIHWRLHHPPSEPTLLDPCPDRSSPRASHALIYRYGGIAECSLCGALGKVDDSLERSTPQGLARGSGQWVLARNAAGDPLWKGRAGPVDEQGLAPVKVLVELVVHFPVAQLERLPSAPSPDQVVVSVSTRRGGCEA